MKIPKTTKKERFYVATSMEEAFSSWASKEDALKCIARFRVSAVENPHYYANDYARIIGIVHVNNSGRRICGN